ncbi:MAG: TolC family protein [Bdellovibrio sp.]
MKTSWAFRKFLSFSFIFLNIYPLQIVKADVLRLHEAVNEVLSNSPQLQKTKSQFNEAHWKKIESFAGFLPSLRADVSYLLDKRFMIFDVNLAGNQFSIPQILPTTNYILTAQWSLFDGFSSINRYKSSAAFEQSAKMDFDWTSFQLEKEVTLLFYQAVVAKELKIVADQNLEVLRDHLKNVRLFKRTGASTNYDVLRVEVQLSQAQTDALNAADNVELSRSRLSEVLGRDVDIDDVIGSLPKLSATAVSDIKYAGVEEREDLESLKQKIESSLYQENSIDRYWIPRISLTGQYQYYNNRDERFDDYSQFRDAFQYGVLLTWNIFDGMTSIAKSKQSTEQRYQAEKTLRLAQLKAKRDYDLWKRKYIYYCNVYESSLDNIAKSEESVRLAKEGQRVGARTNTDVLDAEAELYRAKAGALNAQVGSIEAILNLELSLGKKIIEFR